jgi:hypothetical protein
VHFSNAAQYWRLGTWCLLKLSMLHVERSRTFEKNLKIALRLPTSDVRPSALRVSVLIFTANRRLKVIQEILTFVWAKVRNRKSRRYKNKEIFKSSFVWGWERRTSVRGAEL